MDNNYFQLFLEEEERKYTQLNEIDKLQKEKGEYYCRYITKSFADRLAYYQICEETPRKYILQWAAGEDPYPGWGAVVKLPKKEVQKMIKNRDSLDEYIKERKGKNA